MGVDDGDDDGGRDDDGDDDGGDDGDVIIIIIITIIIIIIIIITVAILAQAVSAQGSCPGQLCFWLVGRPAPPISSALFAPQPRCPAAAAPVLRPARLGGPCWDLRVPTPAAKPVTRLRSRKGPLARGSRLQSRKRPLAFGCGGCEASPVRLRSRTSLRRHSRVIPSHGCVSSPNTPN